MSKLQPWVEYLEMIKYERICLSCWLGFVSQYLERRQVTDAIHVGVFSQTFVLFSLVSTLLFSSLPFGEEGPPCV